MTSKCVLSKSQSLYGAMENVDFGTKIHFFYIQIAESISFMMKRNELAELETFTFKYPNLF